MDIYIYIYIYIYKKLNELGTVELKQFMFTFSYILYCMRYIGNRCQSKKVVNPFNSKGELMEEGRMSYIYIN